MPTPNTKMQEWLDTYAVGFDGVSFQIFGDAQWGLASRVIEQPVSGYNITLSQFMGMGPWRVSYDIRLSTIDDYRALIAKIGTEGDLLGFADTIAAPVTPVVIAGVAYDKVVGCLLKSVTNARFLRDRVECTAEFTVPYAIS